MSIQIVTPEERLAEPRGVHALITGVFGVGKTSLLRTLDPETTLFVNIENGDLAVHDVTVPHVRPQTWQELRDLIVKIAGPNPSFGKNEAFSQAHFDHVGGFLPGIENYRTIFFDTVNAATRLCFRWASGQPEAFTERGKADLRSVYGLARARIPAGAAPSAKRARSLNVILINALETVTDDYGRTEHRLQMEGQRVPREIPGIVDQVITMAAIDFGDGKPIRAFVCTIA